MGYSTIKNCKKHKKYITIFFDDAFIKCERR